MEFCFKNDLYDLMDYCYNQLVYKTNTMAQLCYAKLLINKNKEAQALQIYETILTEKQDQNVVKEKALLLYKMNKGNSID